MLDVRSDGRLQAAVLAYKAAPRDVQRIVRQDTVATFRSQFRSDVRSAGSNAARVWGGFAKFTRTGVALSGGNPPVMKVYQGTRPLSGGATPAQHGRLAEWGTDSGKVTTYTRTSPKGKRHQVRRHTTRGLPKSRRTGYATAPVLRETGTAVVGYWVAAIVRVYRLASEGRTT